MFCEVFIYFMKRRGISISIVKAKIWKQVWQSTSPSSGYNSCQVLAKMPNLESRLALPNFPSHCQWFWYLMLLIQRWKMSICAKKGRTLLIILKEDICISLLYTLLSVYMLSDEIRCCRHLRDSPLLSEFFKICWGLFAGV